MSDWLARTHLLCPTCGYDISQTIADRFEVCPECGGEISEFTCARDVARIPRRMRLMVYASWLAPLAAAPLVSVADWRIFAGASLASVGLVYAGWWRVEAWLGGPGAWWRAIGPAIATVLLVLWAGSVVALLVGAILASA